MRGVINPPASAEDDVNLALLKIAFPAFWFSQHVRGRRLRWVAVRKNGTDPGLHSMVTEDLAELCTALLPDEAETGRWHPECCLPGTRQVTAPGTTRAMAGYRASQAAVPQRTMP